MGNDVAQQSTLDEMSDIAVEAAATPVVRARGVTKRYRSTLAVVGLDVDIGHGITGLLGPNGAGKTTFISLVLGLRTRDAGELTVLGHDPATAGIDVRARIGFAPEHHNLPPDVHAADLVRHLGELHGLPRRAAIQRANDALWQVGLGEERFRPIGTMSTGQRQRVKLAGAIVHDPDLVLLDEPTDGLDPLQRDDMLALIRRVGTEFGMDIVISSHHLEEAEQICDAVVILGDGAVVRAGILSELSRSDTERLVVVVDDRTPSSPRCSAPPASRSTRRARRSASSSSTGCTTPSGMPSPISASGFAASLPSARRSRTSTWRRARERPGRAHLRRRLPGVRRPAQRSDLGARHDLAAHAPARPRACTGASGTRCCRGSRS